MWQLVRREVAATSSTVAATMLAWKSAASCSAAVPRLATLAQFHQQRQRIEIPGAVVAGAEREGECLAGTIPGERLEFHRGLTLIARHAPDAEHRARGIEQSPHRGGQRAVEATVHLDPGDVTFARGHVGEGQGKRLALRRIERERTEGGAPRLPGGEVATGKGQVAELTESPVGAEVGEQDLGAPHLTVVAVSGAIVGDPDRGAELTVLGEDGRDVGVVVLHRDQWARCHRLGDPGRVVARVQVARDHLRGDLEQRPESQQGVVEVLLGLEALEVADVLRHVGAIAVDQGEGVLEVGSDGQQRHRTRHRQGERQRRDAAGPAEQQRLTAGDPDHRVVVAGHDLAVVHQEAVGDAAEALAAPRRCRSRSVPR